MPDHEIQFADYELQLAEVTLNVKSCGDCKQSHDGTRAVFSSGRQVQGRGEIYHYTCPSSHEVVHIEITMTSFDHYDHRQQTRIGRIPCAP